jgi:hypothetical protein
MLAEASHNEQWSKEIPERLNTVINIAVSMSEKYCNQTRKPCLLSYLS